MAISMTGHPYVGPGIWIRIQHRFGARVMEWFMAFARESLHPALAGPVWMAFMRAEFDGAVFHAMKAVEIAVRDAAGLSFDDIGSKLMRKAFDIENGPLTDLEMERSERQARSDLFAGAIGSFKNPQSHRDVALDNPSEAAEIIMFASYLLRVVDAARERKDRCSPEQ